jgi:hypothetical protein
MKTHTPGPWGRVFGSDNLTGNHPADIIGPRGFPIGHAIRPNSAEGGEYTANAQLMCAAPDLLEACKRLIADASANVEENDATVVYDYTVGNRAMEAVRAAIAKAEGR